jgi:hypothetical protein
MHLLVNNIADPDMSDYELRNNSTVFEELEGICNNKKASKLAVKWP